MESNSNCAHHSALRDFAAERAKHIFAGQCWCLRELQEIQRFDCGGL